VKAGEIYKVEIGFEKERHCLQCPMRDKYDDSCNMQQIGDDNLQFDTWEKQMTGCPLVLDREVRC
jgi:hypothetical protein